MREFARYLLTWKHSGFLIDNSAKCVDTKSQENLAEYILQHLVKKGRAPPQIFVSLIFGRLRSMPSDPLYQAKASMSSNPRQDIAAALNILPLD